MSIEMSAQCFVCHMGHQVDAARALGDEETALAFSKELLELYLDIPAGSHSSWLSPRTAKLFQKYYDVGPDRMWKEKKESNEFVRSKLEEIRAKVNTAADPLFAAIRFSILGNYLDFSALYGEVSFDKLDEMLDNALNMPLDEACYEKLRQDLAKGKKLLYLTDNAGEIGFDRILGEVIHQQYPDLEITFCVRGAPVLNDATRADAEFMGIPFPVIDNGNDLCGTELTLLGEEAKKAMNEADVIIAKGMGNTETLYGCGYPIYYAFLVKCPRFETVFQKPRMTPMLVREQN
jgi:uncharacterized protein with ATP-grasp and redox domains